MNDGLLLAEGQFSMARSLEWGAEAKPFGYEPLDIEGVTKICAHIVVFS
jgi:hypothetical protein